MTKLKFTQLPSHGDMVELLKKNGLPYSGDSVELFKRCIDNDLKGIKEIENYRVYRREYTPAQVEHAEKHGHRVPSSVYYPAELENKVLELLGHDDHAFSGYVFNLATNEILYTWEKSVHCVCGASFDLERRWKDTRTGAPRKEDVETRICPECGRKWIWVNWGSRNH